VDGPETSGSSKSEVDRRAREQERRLAKPWMIAALIGITSLASAIQFVYYCRSALASTKNAEPSGHVLRAVGLEGRKTNSADFERFLELVRLCPEHGKDAAQIRGVVTYYHFVRLLARLLQKPLPSLSSWARQEQRACSHFAAIVLDRRIASSRNLFLERGTDRP
jgi:hypothetical protein